MTEKIAAIYTLGCRSNQYDELLIAQSLMEAGFIIVPFDEVADLYVINTCTVTHRGDADSRKATRNALRRNPGAFVIVAGCYSEWGHEEIAEIEGVDLILGNSEKMRIADFIPEILYKNDRTQIIVSGDSQHDSFGAGIVTPMKKSRATLKIQDGCDMFCSYCIVPHVRGKPRSLPIEDVLERICEIALTGYPEIVLTGIHLGLWGREHGYSLKNLVERIDDLDGEFRIRLSSIEPMELTDELIEAMLNSTRICRHLHAPIQSASDSVLKMMKRPYKILEVARIFDRIKSHDSGWNIGTDLMIGFPSQDDEDFKSELKTVEKLPVDYYHLFTYSPRKGTEAFSIKPVTDSKTIKSRLIKLKAIDTESRLRFKRLQINRTLSFIIEQPHDEISDIINGISDNFISSRIVGRLSQTGFQYAEFQFEERRGFFAEIKNQGS